MTPRDTAAPAEPESDLAVKGGTGGQKRVHVPLLSIPGQDAPPLDRAAVGVCSRAGAHTGSPWPRSAPPPATTMRQKPHSLALPMDSRTGMGKETLL